ncbi:MAG: hypothetical protein M3P23_00280 [Actinomycetota bacterium]|nr:hypothetical protein [Actinomycetota bacterium]
MTDTIVLLTEQALDASDATRIAALHEGETLSYRVLVPADTERNLLADVVDHLSLGELRAALNTLRGREPSDDQARTSAADALAASIAALHEIGAEAIGEVTQDDPLPALSTAVTAYGAREVVVVTRPHAVEDTFHRDWASRARERLGVPVLHVYAGTTFLG